MTIYALVPIGMAVVLTLLGVALMIVDSVPTKEIIHHPEEEES